MDLLIVSLHPYDLVHRTVQLLQAPIVVPAITELPDNEVVVQFSDQASFKNKIVVVIAPTHVPVHDNFVRFSLVCNEIKNAGARLLIGVIPYLNYSRHYKEAGTGSLGLMIRMLECSGIDEFILIEPHQYEVGTLFTLPVTIISLTDLLIFHMSSQVPHLEASCVVAPDRGAFTRAQTIAQELGLPLLVYDKQRIDPWQTIITGVHGVYTGDTAIVVDDIIATGGTAMSTTVDLVNRGVKKIVGYFVHPLFCDGTRERIEKSLFSQIFVSNSVPLAQAPTEKIKLFDISSALVKTIITLLGKQHI